MLKTVLSIAGSDSSGGAGIQVDIKTILANGAYAMSAITALTAQNTTGVTGIVRVEPEFLRSQIEAVCQDIMPDAVKIGMVADREQIEVIADILEKYSIKNVVADPVLVATSGARLGDSDIAKAMLDKLFAKARLVTPNISEAVELICTAGSGIDDEMYRKYADSKINDEDMEAMAAELGAACPVLIKGGHLSDSANDLLYENGRFIWFKGERSANKNTHGTGCTLSSAIATGLAKGMNLVDAVAAGKEYISKLLESDLNLGSGSGPLDHGYILNQRF